MEKAATRLMLALAAVCSPLIAKPIVVTSEPEGLIVEKLSAAKPDKEGLVLTREVQLPKFKSGAYYRLFSGGVARGNRVEAVAFDSISDLQAYKPSKTRKGHSSVKQGQFMLYPIANDWAVIGRSDKYLQAAAVKVQSVSDEKIEFSLKESGPLMIWCAKGAPKMPGATFRAVGENLYLADLPIEKGPREITVTR